ncbi:MAG: HAMP domain-containing histidine kinase [Rhodospirillales bacterium]|nr:HAMP domain-containing histidine kinase [Rhodospirillales bacterium]
MSDARVEELEKLVSDLRHDIRGALASTRLTTDRMRTDPDPRMQKFAATIDRATDRILERLDATRTVVPPRR